MVTEPDIGASSGPHALQSVCGAGPNSAPPRHSVSSSTALVATLAFATTSSLHVCRQRPGALGRTIRAWSAVQAGAGNGWTALTAAGPSSAQACAPSYASLTLRQSRHQLNHQHQYQFQQRRLMSWLPRRCATAPANAPSATSLRPGLGPHSGTPTAVVPTLPRPLPRRLTLQSPGVRLMATEAQQAAASPSSSATAAAPRSLLHRLRGRMGDAVRLQLAAAWQSYAKVVCAVGALTAVYLTWRLMHGITNTFIVVNDKMAEYGLICLAVTAVLLCSLYLRWRLEISPAAVYRLALVRLNTSPGVLEVMGAPLVGSRVRAYVVTGGGVYLSKKFKIKLRSRRIQMMFPLSGSERKGLASLEAKRKRGKYVWKLLAVDLGPELQPALPSGGATGLPAGPPPKRPPTEEAQPPQARLYVIGDLAAYQRGGVLGPLRAPFLNALSNSRSYEVEDELEDELQELEIPPPSSHGRTTDAVRKVRSALASAAKLLTKPSPSPTSAGAAAATTGAATVSTVAKAAAESQAATASPSGTPPPPPPRSMLGEQQQPQQQQSGGGSSWWGRMRTMLGGA